MKIIYMDLKANGKKYFCKDVNETFEVKDGNLIATTRSFSMAELFKMEFEEIKEMKNPYERVEKGEEYYFIDKNGRIDFFEDRNDGFDDYQFKNANYFNNRNYTEYIAFKETLMRRMDKFAWEHNARVIDWNDDSSEKYYIIFDHDDDKLRFCCNYTVQSNNIYFTSREIAEKAIEEFKEDLIKLYTWKFDF